MGPFVGIINKRKKGEKNLVFLICGCVFWFICSLLLLLCNIRTPSLDCLVLVYIVFSFCNHINLERKNASFFFVGYLTNFSIRKIISSSRSTHLRSCSTFSSSRIYTIPTCLSQQFIGLLYIIFKLKIVKHWLSKCKWSHYMNL
jgi:hypothetical protein